MVVVPPEGDVLPPFALLLVVPPPGLVVPVPPLPVVPGPPDAELEPPDATLDAPESPLGAPALLPRSSVIDAVQPNAQLRAAAASAKPRRKRTGENEARACSEAVVGPQGPRR